jgi:peptidoglycan hydrolase-like protein with peptidoglycan-binding domain
LDGQKVLVLHTRVPLWRGLESGTKGDDVTGLQEALAAAGYDVPATGAYGSVTDKALRDLMRAAGLTLTSRDATPFDHIAWIPQGTITAETCPFSLGDQVSQGQDIITLPKALTQITVQNPPANRMPGARTLDLGGFTIVTPEDGVVTDVEQLAALAGSTEYRYGVAAVPDAVISVDMEWRLQDSVDVVSVPPRAVFGLNNNQGCVATGDTTLPVTVVSSSLGSALVRFADGVTPPTTVDLDKGDRACP